MSLNQGVFVARLGNWVWALLVASTLGSCRLESDLAPRTQVVVDIDADAALRRRSQQLQLVVTGGATRAELNDAEPSLTRDVGAGRDTPLQWPLRLVLAPREDKPERVFELTATALAGAERLVQRRVISGYVAGEVRYVHLVLGVDCVAVRCGSGQTCAAGSCGDAFIEARDLPRFWPNMDAGHATDSGSVPADAAPAIDAGQKNGPRAPDASLRRDAGPDIAVAGAGDACGPDHGGCDPLVTCQSVDGVPHCGDCPPGYRDVHGDGTQCEDIDECLVAMGGCDALHADCMNTPGGHDCRCRAGYHGDGKRCTINTPCTLPSDCAVTARCLGIEEQQLCVCNAGYVGDGAHCDDVDECAKNTDNCDDAVHACVNDPGGFRCVCPSGYSGDGQGVNGCADLNECVANSDNCDDQPEACINDIGSFHCVCPSGYSGDGRGATGCIDVDECKANTDGCDDTPDACLNDLGAFHCACPAGYTGAGVGTQGCADINECVSNVDGCDDMPEACVNDPGLFHCACPPGYTGDGKGAQGCVDVDECAAKTDNCIALVGACVNDPGTFHCQCPAGYVGTGVGASGCSDLDECATATHTCSRVPPVACTNIAGGFTCGSCPPGYSGDGHSCTDIDECMNGTNTCSKNPLVPCINTPGSYLCGTCPVGYMGDGLTCVDRDECQDGTHTCSRTPAVSCTNSIGSYSCGSCPVGYSGDGHSCTDIDECLANNGGCDTAPMAQCTNTPGSRSCTCPAGTTTHNAAIGPGGCEPVCTKCYEGWDGQSGACSSASSVVPSAGDTAQGGLYTVAPNTLFGFQISLPANARVTGLGVFSRAAADGPRFRVGLYADAAGAPGTLVAQTAWFTMLGAGAVNELPPQTPVSCFVAGGTYWVIGLASGNDVVLGQAAAGSVAAVSLAGQSELPSGWPGGGAVPGIAPLSLFVRFDHP